MPAPDPSATAPGLPPLTDLRTPVAGDAPELTAPPTGQLLLGTDKRNPVFAVYTDAADERLLVFYGFEIVEIVPNDAEAPAFKLMVARLYNSGVKLGALCESFQVDPKTVRRWGKALRQGDPAELVRVLEGRSAGRKRTLAVENFARLRWPHLVAEGSYGAVGRLLREIDSVFGVKLSRSSVGGLIRELKAGTAPLELAPVEENSSSVPPGPEADPAAPSENGETGANSRAEITADTPADGAASPAVQAGASPGDTSHPPPFFPKDPAAGLYWCDHAGVLIFAAALAAVSKVSGTCQAILAQWMAALWLGAQNIEQTKFLNWEDLELILGGVVRFPTPQREQLKSLAADPGLIDALWRFNSDNLGPAVGTDFYFDPHTKLYTGEQNVLKGWCPRIRFADKVLHSDFIHTAQGAPIY